MKQCLSILLSLLLLAGCEKKELLSDIKNFTYGSYLNLVNADKVVLDYSRISSENITIKVRPVGVALDKINVYAVPGGENLDTTAWKLVKSFAVTDTIVDLSVSAADLATAFGMAPADFEPGGSITLYNETVTKDGRRFKVTNTDADLQGQPAFNAAFRWTATVICPFNKNDFNGSYTVVADDWGVDATGERALGDVINVVPGPGDNQISLVKPYGNDAKNIVIDVDPASGAASVAGQVYGTYPFGFNNHTITSTGTANFVFSCTQTITLQVRQTVDEGAFGTFNLVLKK